MQSTRRYQQKQSFSHTVYACEASTETMTSEKLTSPEMLVRFVQTVEKYPQIYVPSLANTKHELESAWQEISQHFDESATNCASKWHTIRSNFNRSLRVKTKTKRPYYLGKYLKFLLPYLKARNEQEYANIDWESSVLPQKHENDFDQTTMQCFTPEDEQSFEQLTPSVSVNVLPIKEEEQKEFFFGQNDNTQYESPYREQAAAEFADEDSAPDAPNKRRRVENEQDSPAPSTPQENKERVNREWTESTSDMDFFRCIMPILVNLNDSEKLTFRITTMQNLQKIIDAKNH